MEIKDKHYSIEELKIELNTTTSRIWYLVRKENIHPSRRLDLKTQDFFKGYDSKVRLLFSQLDVEVLKKSHVNSRAWSNERVSGSFT